MLCNSIYSKVITFTAALTIMQGCGGGDSTGQIESALTFINSDTAMIIENSTDTIITVKTEKSENILFSIEGGADSDLFVIDATSGALSFITAADFEDAVHTSSYSVLVKATDTTNNKSATKLITITVTDDTTDNADNTPPVFDSNSVDINVAENKLIITTIHASDESTVTYQIDGGLDENKFLIDTSTGELTFNHFTPDYELPSDSDKDRVYEVVIAASDQAANKAIQTFYIHVTDVADTGSGGVGKVLKTGVNDGPNNSTFGDPRIADKNGEVVSIGENGLFWEDTDHVNTPVTFDQAATYCSGLTLGGRSWRVPTRKELFEIVSYGTSPTIDAAFTHKNTNYYWTKTTLLQDRMREGVDFTIQNMGWFISFSNGDDDFTEKSEQHRVRCVSGGASFSISGSFTENNDYIQDNVTGLQWENNDTAIGIFTSWDDAKTRCENLGDKTWRLPNINELHTIMPESEMDVLLYPYIDPSLHIGPFWSSTGVRGNAEQAIYMENRQYLDPITCNDGNDTTICRHGDTQNNAVEPKTNAGSIRSICVRGGRL